MFSDLILKWSVGSQDTVILSEQSNQDRNIFLCKLSIRSFQNWFPGAKYIVLYNGNTFNQFCEQFNNIAVSLLCPVKFINQIDYIDKNPYKFYPRGVWWKWLPFRIDTNCHEIYIDSDIFCISEPKSWYEWFSDSSELLIAPERYERVNTNTCGEFCNHPLLKNKKPFNCGIVGQKKNCNYESDFFNIANSVHFGDTVNSVFISEQGAINLWVRSLTENNINYYKLDFNKNAWLRDYIFLMRHGIIVETVHAVTWYKNIVFKLKDLFGFFICNKISDFESWKCGILGCYPVLNEKERFLFQRQLFGNNLTEMLF